MEDLLFLSHRIPFPPNKGDKIRSFHILRQLSRSYCVHLGAFVDTPADEQYIDAVSQYCDETCILNLKYAAKSLIDSHLLQGQRIQPTCAKTPPLDEREQRVKPYRVPVCGIECVPP